VPSLRDIRRRIRSVKNMAQITKAMEMVAASRMRRAQQRVLAARPYAEAMRALIGELSTQGAAAGQVLHPLLAQRPIHTVGVLLMTPDRGLAGPLNTNIIRRGTELIVEQENADLAVEVVTVGRKGQDFFLRRGRKLLGTFTGIVDRPSYDDVIPVARVIMDGYVAGVLDRAYIVYPRFVSTLVQRPEAVQLLPIAPAAGEVAAAGRPAAQDYIYEPDPATILEALLPRYVEVQIYQALLETAASEQSARMVAMQNASDNAKELVESLTLSMNKARQAAITRELAEIVGGAAALEQG
jgi:F-type H+-transporting ATPase subunit gamma